MKYKAAVIQMDSTADWHANRDKIEVLTRRATAAGAQFVLLPERSDFVGRGTREHARDHQQEMMDFYSGLARKCGIYLHLGSIAEHIDGVQQPHNTSFLFNPEGNVISKYQKIHLFEVDIPGGLSLTERNNSTAGHEEVVAETPLDTFGMTICYDLRFPELYRDLAIGGAQTMLVPANFTTETGRDHWEILLRARAIENTCYVLAAGQCGDKPKYHAYGHSLIIDPWGKILAEAGDEEEIIYAMIDEDEVSKTRSKMPSLYNRRPEVYR